jgi:hypothetical protein
MRSDHKSNPPFAKQKALLQYGFLPPDGAGGLALMDRPGHAEAGGGHTHAAPQRDFDGACACVFYVCVGARAVLN